MSKNGIGTSSEMPLETRIRLDGLLRGPPPGKNATDSERERYAEGVFDRGEQHSLPDESIQGNLFSDETST